MLHEVIIIGSGPAGLTAGVYTARAGLKPLIIDGKQPGGQLMTTTAVENWPGDVSILGPQLMMRMRKHPEAYGANYHDGMVMRVDFSKQPYTLFLDNGTELRTKSVIIASGASHKKLNIPGEQKYWAKGVSVCATCDAPFFRDQEVVIVGGGNTAMTEAAFLSRFVTKMTIVQITEAITANDPIKNAVLKDPKTRFIYSSTLTEIKGNGSHVTGVVVEDQKTKKLTEIPCSGVFVAIGFKPNTGAFQGQLAMDEYGYLKLTDHTTTSKEGVFAAGDVSDYRYMQAITAAGLGCMAALDCERYLKEQESK